MASEASSLFMILEKLQVAPAFNSPESATELSLPLTFFDTLWLKFPPVERIFFYELAKPPAYINSVVLPKLKESLSRTLFHFLPLAGHLIWPPNSDTPVILYSPHDGAVSLTIAQSNIEDYDHLCGNDIHESSDSRPYVPELPVSDTKASAIALQITVFPNKGFSIGIISHHAVLDGKSVIMFMKAWAYLCNLLAIDQPYDHQLPDELVPFFDRDGIHDAAGLRLEFLNHWVKSDSSSNPRSLKPWSNVQVVPKSVRATFELTRQDIGKLREWVSSQLNNDFPKEEVKPVPYLSTFVLVCAYTLVCLVKVRQGDGDRDVYFVFSVDSRSRLDPPLPQNYLGNAICGKYFAMKARQFMDENGVAMAAKGIAGTINDPEKGLIEELREVRTTLSSLEPGTQCLSVAGSNRFGVYGLNFGWGRTRKVEITSIDRTGALSLAESRDGNGGVEIGLVLTRHEMEAFTTLFVNGLNEL